jgi:cholesterol 7alpha-monooxygenase
MLGIVVNLDMPVEHVWLVSLAMAIVVAATLVGCFGSTIGISRVQQQRQRQRSSTSRNSSSSDSSSSSNVCNFYEIPSWTPMLHHALAFGRNSIEFIAKQFARYGKVWAVRLAGNRFVFICDRATFFRRVLPNRDLSLDAFVAEYNEKMFGLQPGISRSEAVRQLNAQVLHQSLLKQNLEQLNRGFYEAAQRLIQLKTTTTTMNNSNNNTCVPLYRFVQELTFNTVVEALFGRGFVAQDQAAMLESTQPPQHSLFQLFTQFEDNFDAYILGASLPGSSWLWCRRAYQVRDQLCARLAQTHAYEGESDLIRDRRNFMLNYTNGCGGGGGDKDNDPLKNNLFLANNGHALGRMQAGLLWGAASNTVPAVFWSLFDLLLNPQALSRVRSEYVDAVAAEHKATAAKTNEKAHSTELYSTALLNELRYLESCIHETLRRIATCTIQRQATVETEVELLCAPCRDCSAVGNPTHTTAATHNKRSILLRPADIVCYPGSLDNFNAELYPEPHTFCASRFYHNETTAETSGTTTASSSSSSNKAFDTLAFGAGNRMCPGRYWAINEIKMMVLLLTTAYDFELQIPEHKLTQYRKQLPYDRTRLQSLAGPLASELKWLQASITRKEQNST